MPHIVHLGGQFTVDFSPVEGFGDDWNIRAMGVPGIPDAGCTRLVRSCTFQVPLDMSLTDAYTIYTLNFGTIQGPAYSNVYLAVINHRALTGTVKTPGGRPIQGAALSIIGPSGALTTSTDMGGAYGVILSADTYHVRVASAPGSNEPAKVSACSGQVSGAVCTVDLASADGTASFTVPAATVTGVVVDQAGKPQPDVVVNLTGANDQGAPVSQQTSTDQGGRYTFGPSPGTYTVAPVVPLEGVAEGVANGYKASSCPGGTAISGACQALPVPTDVTAVVDFVYGCGVEGVRLDTVAPVVDSKFGAIPYSTVKLTGKGFCPDMKVDFGNHLAETTVSTLKDPFAITDKGTHAQVTVARLATAGTVTVTSDGQKATLDDVPVDSFRNVSGLNFRNTRTGPNSLTVAMFEHVFSAAANHTVMSFPIPGGHLEAITPQADEVFKELRAVFGGGLCFGFALAAERMSTGGDMSPASFARQPVDSAWEIEKNANVVDLLGEMQLTQFSTQIQSLISQARIAVRGQGGAYLMSQIRADLGAGPAASGQYGTGALILITQPTSGAGHAVLAYNVEEDNSGPDQGIVDVYDPNQPFAASEDHDSLLHQKNVDRSRVTINSDGTWSFPGLGWSGNTDDIAVLRYSAVMSAINAGLLFANPGGVSATPGPGTVVAALSAPDGNAVDLAQGGSQQVVVNPPLVGGPPSALQPFTGPVGMYEERLTSKGTVSQTLQFNGYQVTVDASSGTDKVVFDTATAYIAVGPAATGTPSKSASVTVAEDTANGGVQSATVTGSPRSGPLALQFPVSGQATLTGLAHRARGLALTLSNQQGVQVPQIFSTSLAIPAGSSALVSPLNWAQFKGGSLTAAIESPGKFTKTVTLKDQAHLPPQPRLRQLRESGHTVLASLTLPALPSGSTLSLVTAFLSGTKVEHQVKTVLTKLGRASARTVRVHVPAGLPSGSTAAVTLIAFIGGTSGPVVTSTATISLRAGT